MKLLPLFDENAFETITELVKNKEYDPKEVSEKGSNLFLYASYYAKPELMQFFYEHGLDINQLVKGEISAFSLAAMSLEGIKALKNFLDKTHAPLNFYSEDVLSTLAQSDEHEEIFKYLIENFNIQDDITNEILKHYPQGLSYYFNTCNIDPYEFVLKCIKEKKHLSPFMIIKEDDMPEQDAFFSHLQQSIQTYDKDTFLKIKKEARSYMTSFTEANLHHCYVSNKALSHIMSIMYLDVDNPLSVLSAEVNEIEEEAYRNELSSICRKYNLHNISIENGFLTPHLIYFLENALKTVKEFFKLQNHEVGEGVLELNFLARDVSGPKGYFHGPSTSITITKNCGLSIFLHEYTHFRQYAGFSANENLKEAIKPAIKTLMHSFESHYSTAEEFKEVITKFASLYLNNLDEFNQTIANLIDFKTEWKYMQKSFERIIQKELNEGFNENKKVYSKMLLSEIKLRVMSFQEGKSLASSFYKKLNKLKREHIKTNYWTEPVELHARMNEALANQDNYQDKNPLFNSFLLRTIKPQLEKFNSLLISNARMLKNENKFIQRQIVLKH